MISRQYLCQTSAFVVAATLLAFTALDDYSGYLLFVWIYGFFYGGYVYSLKMFCYEKVRARNFNRAWGFIQTAQSLPLLVGVPLSGEFLFRMTSDLSLTCYSAFLNDRYGGKCGFYLSAVSVAAGAMVFFFIDAHKKSVAQKRKMSSPPDTPLTANSQIHQRPTHEMPLAGGGGGGDEAARAREQELRSQYFNSLARTMGRDSLNNSTESLLDMNLQRLARIAGPLGVRGPPLGRGNQLDSTGLLRPNANRTNSIFSAANGELTCISEEVLVLDQNLFDDCVWDDSCLTSCNKEEKFLMLSEYENNFDERVVPAEAARLIQARKDELIRGKAFQGVHHEGCPIRGSSKHAIDMSVNTLDMEKSTLAKRRRASYAGFATNGNYKQNNFGQNFLAESSATLADFVGKLSPLVEQPSTSSSSRECIEPCPANLQFVQCSIETTDENCSGTLGDVFEANSTDDEEQAMLDKSSKTADQSGGQNGGHNGRDEVATRQDDHKVGDLTTSDGINKVTSVESAS